MHHRPAAALARKHVITSDAGFTSSAGHSSTSLVSCVVAVVVKLSWPVLPSMANRSH